jgi:hypothetical protein
MQKGSDMPDRLSVVDEVIERHLSELALPGVLSVCGRDGNSRAGGRWIRRHQQS